MKTTQRNYGIDLLRIVSLLLVTILHILGHGGVLSTVKSFKTFTVLWFLEILAFPAVNCFLLISGYVGYKKEKYVPKLSNLISLFFYSFVLQLITMLFRQPFTSGRNN